MAEIYIDNDTNISEVSTATDFHSSYRINNQNIPSIYGEELRSITEAVFTTGDARRSYGDAAEYGWPWAKNWGVAQIVKNYTFQTNGISKVLWGLGYANPEQLTSSIFKFKKYAGISNFQSSWFGFQPNSSISVNQISDIRCDWSGKIFYHWDSWVHGTLDTITTPTSVDLDKVNVYTELTPIFQSTSWIPSVDSSILLDNHLTIQNFNLWYNTYSLYETTVRQPEISDIIDVYVPFMATSPNIEIIWSLQSTPIKMNSWYPHIFLRIPDSSSEHSFPYSRPIFIYNSYIITCDHDDYVYSRDPFDQQLVTVTGNSYIDIKYYFQTYGFGDSLLSGQVVSNDNFTFSNVLEIKYSQTGREDSYIVKVPITVRYYAVIENSPLTVTTFYKFTNTD